MQANKPSPAQSPIPSIAVSGLCASARDGTRPGSCPGPRSESLPTCTASVAAGRPRAAAMRRAAAFALLAAWAAGARCPAGALGGGTEPCGLRSHSRALDPPPGGLDLGAGLLPPPAALAPAAPVVGSQHRSASELLVDCLKRRPESVTQAGCACSCPSCPSSNLPPLPPRPAPLLLQPWRPAPSSAPAPFPTGCS